MKRRSIRLDIAARDSSGKPYDIEIQKVNDNGTDRRYASLGFRLVRSLSEWGTSWTA